MNKSLCIFAHLVLQIMDNAIPENRYILTWLVKLKCWVVYLFVWEYIFYFSMNFFESKVNDLTKIAWGILAPWPTRGEHTLHLYGVWPGCVSQFSLWKWRIGMRRCGGTCVGLGKAELKERAALWPRLDHRALDSHSTLVEPLTSFTNLI